MFKMKPGDTLLTLCAFNNVNKIWLLFVATQNPQKSIFCELPGWRPKSPGVEQEDMGLEWHGYHMASDISRPGSRFSG